MSKRSNDLGPAAKWALALASAIALVGSATAQSPIAYPTNPGGKPATGKAPVDSGSVGSSSGDEAGSSKGIIPPYTNVKQKSGGTPCSDCHASGTSGAAFDLDLHRKRAPQRFKPLPEAVPPAVKRKPGTGGR